MVNNQNRDSVFHRLVCVLCVGRTDYLKRLAHPARLVQEYSRALALVLAVACLVATVLIVKSAENKADRSLSSDYDGCLRISVVIAQANKVAYGQYTLLTAIAPVAMSSPFAAKLTLAQEAETWLPVPDCHAKVNSHGASYTLSQPIEFAKQLPPRSDLAVPEGTLG